MSDEDNKKCPLCGKETSEGELFCRDCQEIAQNSYSEELLAHNEIIEKEETFLTEEPNEDKEAEVPVRKHGISASFWVGLLIMLLLAACGGYIYLQQKEAKEAEIKYWNQCVIENTPQMYAEYLTQYPMGQFSKEARNKIIELRDEEKKEWEKMKKSSDIDALFAFITDHPEAPYIDSIRHTIDSLSWLKTIVDDTAPAYLAYIENVNIGRFSGKYLPQAQERYDYLSQLKSVEGEDLENVKKAVADFFKSLSDTDVKNLAKVSSPALIRFYDAQNQSPKVIIDSIKSDFRKNRIKGISYTPIADSIDAILDNKGIYFITLPVKTEKNYIDRKKKKETSEYILSIEMNDKKQFQTVYRK